MLSAMIVATTLALAAAAPTAREPLFGSTPSGSYPQCSTEPVSFPDASLAEKNKIFEQLTVAEQLSIEEMMKPMGVSFDDWAKCVTFKCSTIAKLQLVYPPKSEVLAYIDGSGPMPKRMAQFWWLRADVTPRVAQLHEVEMPITASSQPTLVREVPWERRPYVYWELDELPMGIMAGKMEALTPVFADMLASVTIGDDMKALNPDEYGPESIYPYIMYTGNGMSVPGSTPEKRVMLGHSMIVSGPEDGWTMGLFKAAPLTWSYYIDWEAEDVIVYDLTFCPGAGNPVFDSIEAMLAAFNDGSLIMCEIDGEFYGSTKEYMDPAKPYFPPADALAKAEPRIYYPDGPRFAVHDRTVSWMGWDFHTDIHPLTGLHIMNLRFQGERIAYEMHATDFTAVYSGHSSKKDLFYSDGGYEMGNCATTLKVGLQCPEGSVFLPSLGYDSGYIWGAALTEAAENPMATCIFEAPNNEALFQHAQMRYEGLPSSSLFVRTVLTVGNYDYTQTFKLNLDGSFDLFKQLSGYAVGAYVLPETSSSYQLQQLYGALLSKSSIGALHTHSAGYKVDLDIGGMENNFKVKTPMYGPIADALTAAGIDPATIAFSSPNSYYYDSFYVKSEGVWDNDGDMTWTPPEACLKGNSYSKYIVESKETTTLGHKRAYVMSVPTSFPQALPEHDPYLHIQNFTKCDIAATTQADADVEAVSMDVFGNMYPNPAPAGYDLSHFFNSESLEDVDLVVYAHSTKPHYVKTEDLPVPSTMGKEISFVPFNYFKDDISPIKYLPDFKQEVTKCAP